MFVLGHIASAPKYRSIEGMRHDFIIVQLVLIDGTPPASKSPAPIMDLGAQDQRKNAKSEGLQWDLRILELDLRFRG